MNSVIGVMLAVTILSAGNVRAEEQGFEPTLTAQPSMSTGLKSPGTATGLSFAGLVVPIGISAMVLSSGSGGGSGDVGLGVLIVAGTILGPGLGHAYAGESGRFWRGAGLRTLSWGVMIGAAALAWDGSNEGGSAILALGSMSLYVASTIYDLATAGDSASRHNEKLASHKVSVEPVWAPRDQTVGIRVAVGF